MPSSGQRGERGAGKKPREWGTEQIQKTAVTCWKLQEELWHVSSFFFFFSFDKYILTASYVRGGIVNAEIRTGAKSGKNPCPFIEETWRGRGPPPGDF